MKIRNKHKKQRRKSNAESGNVLFLILIAVALFAALSYAVTQSTRSGGGDPSEETNLISSAQLTQYPASIRTAIVRMIINGTAVDQLSFNVPSDFGNLGDLTSGVFHPSGGGAIYSPAPPEVMEGGGQGAWYFNGQMEIPFVGTAGADGNDLIAFLPGIRLSVCRKVNNELGIGNVAPQLAADRSGDYETRMLDDDASTATLPTNFPTGSDEPDIDDGANSFDGQAFGCFQNNGSGNEYVYFHVLVER